MRTITALNLCLGLLATILLSPIANAYKHYPNFNPTSAELRLLPDYCRSAHHGMENTPVALAKREKWEPILGKNYNHIHHYCSGLLAARRSAREINEKKRMRQYKRVVGEMNYVDKHFPADYVLRPELHVKRGRALAALGQKPKAISEFHAAIKSKPTYATAYAALFDLYMEMGLVNDAEKTLKAGLARKPQSKVLKGRMGVLNRKK